jgi:hypothetical protein
MELNSLTDRFTFHFQRKGFLLKVFLKQSSQSEDRACVNMKSKTCWSDDDEDNSVGRSSEMAMEATSYSLVTEDKKHVFDLGSFECTAESDSFTTDSLYPVFVADHFSVGRDPKNGYCITELRGNPIGCVCIIDFALLMDINTILDVVTPMKPKAVVVKRKLETMGSIPLFVVSGDTLSKMKNLCNDCSVSIRSSCMVQQFVSGEDSAGPTSRCEMTQEYALNDHNRLKSYSGKAENHIAVLDLATSHPLDDSPESLLVCLTVHQMFMTCIISTLLKMY